MEIHSSARRHDVADDDIRHAIQHAVVVDDVGEDPDADLSLSLTGPQLPRVVVLVSIEGDEIVIHAMPMRPIYRGLLER